MNSKDNSTQGGLLSLGGLERIQNGRNTFKQQKLWKQKIQSKNKLPNIFKLSKFLARPPGCAFLGAKATTMETIIEGNKQNIIVDSGSDITLISAKFLNSFTNPLKIYAGQKINLVQVTGAATISGYVSLNLIVEMQEGSVSLMLKLML